MPEISLSVPKIPAPQIPVPAVKIDLNVPSVNSAVSNISSGITKNIPSLSAPDLRTSLPNLPNISGGVSSAFGGVTSLADGLKPQLPNLPTNVTLPKFTFDKPIPFPGLGKVGELIGAGPKFISETVKKYYAMVPPYVPGVTINPAMIGGALAVIKAAASANPSAVLKQITQNYADDLKGQLGAAADTAGLNDLKNQAKTLENSVSSATENLKQTIADIQETGTAVTETVTSVAETASSEVSSTASNVASSAGSTVSQTANSVTQATTTRINAFGFPPTG